MRTTIIHLYVAFAVVLYAASAQAQNVETTGQVTVSGNHLMRDGKPWVPHGFYQVPFEVPPKAFGMEKQFWRNAYDGYHSGEYSEMKSQGADSVRLQIAQDAANPDNHKFFDEQWLQQAIGAIQAAREAGLSVIVSIQDEVQTGVEKQAPLPNDATRRVWGELVPVFGKDRGVLLEIYNEPNDLPGPEATKPDINQPPTPEQWQRWAEAMNRTIAFVRKLGAENVVVADGLVHAQQLAGAPDLEDPLHEVLYAAHPYASGPRATYNQTKAAWNEKFGDFARTHPVIISEWGIGFYCDDSTPNSVVNFLNYLHERGIGLEAGIWDFAPPGFANLTHGFPDVKFSSFFNSMGAMTCTQGHVPPFYGPGKTVESYYLTGVPPNSPR